MFLKKMFRSITSLNDKIKKNKSNSTFEDPTSTKNVQKNYIAIGKLAKNADIKAEEVLFLMQPKGLLDVSVLDSNNTNLKKAISHKTKKNAYTKTKEELEKLSKDTEIQDAKLKKAFGRIAGLFGRSLKFKEHKLTGLNSFPKLNDFCRTIIKSNWHIDLKNATTISEINDAKEKFSENICETIRNTELHQNKTYTFTNEWIDDISKNNNGLITPSHANGNLTGAKHSELISEAAAHINECIKEAQQKCQKLEKAIKNHDTNVKEFIKDIENSIPAELLSTTYTSEYQYLTFFVMIKNNLGRKSALFPYYKRLDGGKKLVEAVDKLEQNFNPKATKKGHNCEVIKEFRENLTDVKFTNENDCFVKGFNKFKAKYALKN